MARDWSAHSNRLINHMVWDGAYEKGWREARFPVPAIPLQVKYDYIGCVNIDDVTDPDDPIVIYMYDSWSRRECT